MARPQTIVVVGAGFSGAMLAAQLLRRSDARAVLIERSGRFGPGLAFGTRCPDHLLNVRAARMSALPDDPDHFLRWLSCEAPALARRDAFAPRALYGRYIEHILDEAAADAPGRLARIGGEVVNVDSGADAVRTRLRDGDSLRSDHAVLALGNPAPATPEGFEGLAPDRFVADPWAEGALDGIGPDERLLLAGAGLTQIDVLLTLEAQGWRGTALALSRRGLTPRPHEAVVRHATPRCLRPDALSRQLRAFRGRARTEGWAWTLDALRPYNQILWTSSDLAKRRRFLRHLRPWWDVHRHRTAPEVADRLQAWRAEGRLEVAAGRVVSASGGEVAWRPRGEPGERRINVDRVINCTGPLSDLTRSGDGLHRALLGSGQVRPDPLRLGLDVDPAGRVIGRGGRSDPRLHAIGPLTKGAFWEVVAVPEIRVQAFGLAERLGRGQQGSK